jgi:hypothetical protein
MKDTMIRSNTLRLAATTLWLCACGSDASDASNSDASATGEAAVSGDKTAASREDASKGAGGKKAPTDPQDKTPMSMSGGSRAAMPDTDAGMPGMAMGPGAMGPMAGTHGRKSKQATAGTMAPPAPKAKHMQAGDMAPPPPHAGMTAPPPPAAGSGPRAMMPPAPHAGMPAPKPPAAGDKAPPPPSM